MKPLALVFVVLLSKPVFGVAPNAIHYLDATDGPGGNTRLAAGGPFNAVVPEIGMPGVQGDNQWSNRPFGNRGTVFTTNDFLPPEDAPALVTVIGGLQPGASYKVYSYLWSDISAWHLRASLTGPPLMNNPSTTFSPLPSTSSTAAMLADVTEFATPPLVAESNRLLYEAALGTAVADSAGQINVWIDDYAVGRTTFVRTWYDGVGFALVPEPSTAMLALVGAAIFLRRKA
jgi:hypothetical protein